jgi:hypothetical protein
MVLVERRRRDLTLIDPFETSWVRYNDIVWPDPLDAAQSAARYNTDDVTGVQTVREAAKKGPVYVLDPERADASRLRAAGFDLVRVGENARLYELIPRSPLDPRITGASEYTEPGRSLAGHVDHASLTLYSTPL